MLELIEKTNHILMMMDVTKHATITVTIAADSTLL